MRGIIVAGIIAAAFTSQALAESISPLTGKAADVRSLIARSEAANDKCRGGSGDEPATFIACGERNEMLRRIEALGWCKGKTTDETAADYRWHRCGGDSLRMQAE
jgi:hypothetical protein